MTEMRAKRPVVLCLTLLVLAAVFAALAVWQVERLHWKEALIARVEAGTKAAPLPVAQLPTGALDQLEYRRVGLRGHYLPQGSVLVTGVSTLGAGYWVMTPMRVDGAGRGPATYVNRGFVPMGTRIEAVRARTPQEPVSVIGLLRLTQPGGGFLRANRPQENRWYSRDVVQIAARQGMAADARYFVDASQETPSAAGGPVPGLTVINFPNNHLSYALTWAAMALLSIGTAVVLWRKLR